ncbi:receptor-type guanylate cyclase Gyc76C-like isoform X2 [Neocloeon triangulifer]|uniref:receptor-type guanylate cyclase Gyc76C-like isoform X2 n=1 Tax=Neocloeon triangulifer TaxID=2078957 RepID=UPI00286F2A33|nr:receptor-type guanylate cyclase Gyc76C-like isoform X2 [Neocloeon triangulifer]
MPRGPPSPPGTALLLVLFLLPIAALADDLPATPVAVVAPTTPAPPNLPPGFVLKGASRQRHKITIGYLPSLKGDAKLKMGLTISGAITYALDQINTSNVTLPWVDLLMRYNDTNSKTVPATKALIHMITEDTKAIFGPEASSCIVEATVSQAMNIPMFSHKCADSKANPTLLRIDPPNSQVIKSVLTLLEYLNWRQFSIINEEAWKELAFTLQKRAEEKKFTVNHQRTIYDRHKCCVQKLLCCHAGIWYQIIQETRNKTRIYVFMGTSPSLIDLMTGMQALQLFDNGEYMVIYIDMETYSVRDAVKYLWKSDYLSRLQSCFFHNQNNIEFEKRAKSLLVVAMTPPDNQFTNFTDAVRVYNAKEPFNFSMPTIFGNFKTHIPIFAAYLYDAVMLYANSLHKLISNEIAYAAKISSLPESQIWPTNEKVLELASNGTRIIETILKNGSYQSITGSLIKWDEAGNSEGNFSVIGLQNYNLTEHTNFSCPFHMLPVAKFEHGAKNDTLDYKVIRHIQWPGNTKPMDEPSCGFDNSKCPRVNSHDQSVVAAGTLGVLLFCATVITASIYRKWKIEQEIEGLLWKIHPTELHSYSGDIVSPPSKLSLMSAGSFESRCGPQVFASTGQYRNMVVRIKELVFSKKRDCVTREVMKEMRLLRELRHDNVNSFIGACIEPNRVLIVTDYCAKGSLYDIIENEDIKLDSMFISSLVHDLIKGMRYLHNSLLGCHGNLKSSNCVVTSRWVLQVADFGLHELRQNADNESVGEHQYYRNLFWKAPELLRGVNPSTKISQKGDVYSFGIILYEIIGRRGPFGPCTEDPKEIIRRVKEGRYGPKKEPFRPDLSITYDTDTGCPDYVTNCITACWQEQPENRPDFHNIREQLKKMREGMHHNIVDQMMDMMVKYANHLEELVSERTRLLFEEKQKTEDLLHRMLPAPVARNLTMGIGVQPESYDSVTIYFSDIVGFTSMSAESTPLQVVTFLNDLYTLFDSIIQGYDVYKVETIGDAYMVVSGLPLKNEKHAGEIASMALDLLAAVKSHRVAHRPQETLKLRIGIHTGPVVAGVVGLTMPRYCLFGDTVNTASRMESNGEALRIHISEECRNALNKLGEGLYVVEDRGPVFLKGKGAVSTHWLVSATPLAIQRRNVDANNLPPPLFCRSELSGRHSGSVLGNPGGIGTPVRRRVGVSTSLAAPQTSQPSPSSSTAFRTVSLNDTTDASLMDGNGHHGPKGSCGGSSVVTCPLDLSTAPTVSRSFDPFPSIRGQAAKRLVRPREAKSLEDCCVTVVVPPTPSPVLPNGRLSKHESNESACSEEGTPLIPPKRWRSLEGHELPVDDLAMDAPGLSAHKVNHRGSLKSWLVGILNGNGLKGSHSANASQTSLRKNVYSLPNTMAAAAPAGLVFEPRRQTPKSNDESVV